MKLCGVGPKFPYPTDDFMVVTFQIFSLLLLFGLSFGELFVFCFLFFFVRRLLFIADVMTIFGRRDTHNILFSSLDVRFYCFKLYANRFCFQM